MSAKFSGTSSSGAISRLYHHVVHVEWLNVVLLAQRSPNRSESGEARSCQGEGGVPRDDKAARWRRCYGRG